MLQNPYSRGGQPFAHHTPIFSNLSSLPMRHSKGYLVTMLFHIVSDFPENANGISGKAANKFQTYLLLNELRSDLASISLVF